MAKQLRLSIAALLVFPAALIVWFVLVHLWRLYAEEGPYSFGLHLNYGAVRFRDPMSDALVLFLVVCALVCGVGIARDTKGKRLLLVSGFVALVIIAAGVIGAA